MNAKRSIWMVAVLAFLSATAVAAEENESETWFVVKIAGSPVGFASEIMKSDAREIVFRSHTDLTMTRMGTPLSMFMFAEEVADADGTFRRSRMEMSASIAGIKADAVRRGDSLHVTFETGGHARVQVLAWEEGAVSQSQVEEMSREWLASDSAEMSFKVFDINNASFKEMRMVRGDVATETRDGQEYRYLTVAEYDGGGDVPVSTSYFDENNDLFRTVVSQLGMEIVIERVTEAEMTAIELEPNFDIIRQSAIACEGYPEEPADAESVTMRLEFPVSDVVSRDFTGPNQVVTERGDNWVELTVADDTIKELRATREQLAEFLMPGRYVQSDHPRVRAVADSIRSATGSEGWELASAIAGWVGRHISAKDYSQGFASALEVLDSCAGDCTEHSVLLTALLRAADLPARPAVGLAYANGALVGHMWSEVYVDHWRTLDAIFPDSGPIRLRVQAATDREAVDERGLMQAFAVVGGMSARVTSFQGR